MKKIVSFLSIFLLGLSFAVTDVCAQGRGNSRGGSVQQHKSEGVRPGRNPGNSRPAPSSRPSADHGRPGNSGNQFRPGGNRPGSGNKPDNGVRPGHNDGNRYPGVNNRPATNHRPGHGADHRPGGVNRPQRPGIGGNHHRPGGVRPGMVAPPPRPGRPHFRPWVRPVPPVGWRPVRRTPLLRSFLGLSFGLSLDLSLQSLRSAAYVVDGYNSDQVHLRNVQEQGFYWPDATLYYSGGGLQRSQFYYSTMGNYMSAYNQVFAQLNSNYGAPVEMNSNGTSCYARWFGYGGDYITLEYMPLNSSDGLRYFTILTYGR